MKTIISTVELGRRERDLLGRWELKDGGYADRDLSRAEVLLAWPSEITKGLVNKMTRLKVIQTFSAGVDEFPMGIVPREVRILSNAGAYAGVQAEHAWALVLALAKGVNTRKRVESYMLSDGTLVVLGGGGAGSAVASMGKRCFAMRVIGISQSFRSRANFDEAYGPDRLDLLQSADVLVCALPLTKSTDGMLTYERLASMKEKVIVVNVGRAEVISERAILRLLRERPGMRFGTDVFWRVNGKENFRSELWERDNFAGTFHMAGSSANEASAAAGIFAAVQNLRSFLVSGRSKNEVQREDYA